MLEVVMDNEKAYISCLMRDWQRSIEFAEKRGFVITSCMFEHKLTKNIFDCIVMMIEKNLDIDVRLVYNMIKKTNKEISLEEIIDISNEVSHCANSAHYAEMIYFKYHNKNNMELLRQAAEKIKKDNTANSDDIFQELIDSYNKVEKRVNNRHEVFNFEQLFMKYGNRIMQEKSYTGFKHLDEFVIFNNGYVLTIAGRSGVGKTAFGFQLLKSVADSNKKDGLMVSMEMPGASLYERAIGTYIGFTEKIGYTKDGLKNKISNDLCSMVNKQYENIYVNDQDGLTLSEIEHIIKTTQRKTKNLGVVCIDYLGYIKSESGSSNYEKVSIVARGIKGLAKRLDIKIILLVQTSRDGEDGTIPVKLHHLRDSGAIEESADIVIGLWGSVQQANRLHAEILKNRDGEKGAKFDLLRYNTYLEETNYVEEKDKLDKAFNGKGKNGK